MSLPVMQPVVRWLNTSQSLLPVRVWGRAARLGLLSLLYLSQGMPIGFQARGLPILLRTRGVSLSLISFSLTAMSISWMLKPLFAAHIDNTFSPHIGRRRSWLIPLQFGLAALALVAAYLAGPLDDGAASNLPGLFISCFLLNSLSSAQDIAVDGLAIDILSETELGSGNSIQVVGFKAGMFIGGASLAMSPSPRSTFNIMFLIMLFVAILVLLFPETRLTGSTASASRPATPAESATPEAPCMASEPASAGSWLGRSGVAAFLRIITDRSLLWALLFIITYKTGEGAHDMLFKPLLVDSGLTPARIATLTGLFGAVISVAGSFAGGLLADRHPGRQRLPLLLVILALRSLPMIGKTVYAYAVDRAGSAAGPAFDRWPLLAVIAGESFIGGALTTVTFAFMMSVASASGPSGATRYTAFATVEILGKTISYASCGAIAGYFGYGPVFFWATVISMVPIGAVYMEWREGGLGGAAATIGDGPTPGQPSTGAPARETIPVAGSPKIKDL
ncbi:hypothetical protein H696_03484 [Fonticula alba]|uniref:Major facilitator superfamily (MFS) profile domain-containing protein n=1 Tax=Fonticula alba TaxID=691883 RepID=A0A058Z942_FONAL|nr:hypothetical protein H696_03484 [Fonticula alba]KCV70017.1 hypothetical protein H696_03484 [Fonticula alba]|eukprot:XP_009495623.1 hypothetical protein H696_03484 [Fonticula alba]